MVFVKKLSSKQIVQLQQLLNSAQKPAIFKRAQIILLSNKGKTVPEICEIVEMYRNNVIKWVCRYEKEGAKGLRHREGGGRPPKATLPHKKKMWNVVRQSPRQFGYKQNNWTLSLLRDEMQRRMDLVLSREHIRRILKEGGISFHRPKLQLTSPDPDYFKKNESWSN